MIAPVGYVGIQDSPHNGSVRFKHPPLRIIHENYRAVIPVHLEWSALGFPKLSGSREPYVLAEFRPWKCFRKIHNLFRPSKNAVRLFLQLRLP